MITQQGKTDKGESMEQVSLVQWQLHADKTIQDGIEKKEKTKQTNALRDERRAYVKSYGKNVIALLDDLEDLCRDWPGDDKTRNTFQLSVSKAYTFIHKTYKLSFPSAKDGLFRPEVVKMEDDTEEKPIETAMTTIKSMVSATSFLHLQADITKAIADYQKAQVKRRERSANARKEADKINLTYEKTRYENRPG
jgi:hypothetical protein